MQYIIYIAIIYNFILNLWIYGAIIKQSTTNNTAPSKEVVMAIMGLTIGILAQAMTTYYAFTAL